MLARSFCYLFGSNLVLYPNLDCVGVLLGHPDLIASQIHALFRIHSDHEVVAAFSTSVYETAGLDTDTPIMLVSSSISS